MKILGISAKKQGGKNSSANYITGVILKKHNIVLDYDITPDGELLVLTQYETGEKDWGILDLYRRDYDFVVSAEQRIYPYVKNYSFADSLKETAVNLFELKPESVWGTDKQKMEPTHLRWEDMPGVTVDIDEVLQLEKWYKERFDHNGPCTSLIHHNPGPMTGREFLQFFGTEIGRKIYPNVWVNATINKIKAEQSGLAIVTDLRFPDEVQAIKNAGGHVIRLTREMFPEDKHPSETSLDENVYDWSNFDAVLDNSELGLVDSCKLVEKFARSQNLI